MAYAGHRIALPLRTRAEKRQAERIGVNMPVHVDGRQSITRDLSASGLSFESDRSYAPGDRINLTIEYLLDGHSYPLECEVEVVRVEPSGGRFTIGARLLAPLSQGTAVVGK